MGFPATAHKATHNDVLQFLAAGPQTSQAIGTHFWPDKAGLGPAHGGPTSAATSAARLLGKLRAKRYVDRTAWPESKWYLTKVGRELL